MPKRKGMKMIRLRDDFIAVMDTIQKGNGFTNYTEVERAAGVFPTYNNPKRGKHQCNLSSIITRLHTNGHASTDNEYITTLEQWSGVRLRHENPIPIKKPNSHGRTTPKRPKKRYRNVWIEISQCRDGDKVSVDLMCETDLINLFEFQPLNENSKEDAMVFARLWTTRLGCDLDNMLPVRRKAMAAY